MSTTTIHPSRRLDLAIGEAYPTTPQEREHLERITELRLARRARRRAKQGGPTRKAGGAPELHGTTGEVKAL